MMRDTQEEKAMTANKLENEDGIGGATMSDDLEVVTNRFQTLPDELVTKVMAHLSYPDIFRSICISTYHWSLLQQREEGRVFGIEVDSLSQPWPRYSPFLLEPGGCFFGYDTVTKEWKKAWTVFRFNFPCLEDTFKDCERFSISVRGPLICFSRKIYFEEEGNKFFRPEGGMGCWTKVRNLVTGRSTMLAMCDVPCIQDGFICGTSVLHVWSDEFVLAFLYLKSEYVSDSTRRTTCTVQLQVYNSKEGCSYTDLNLAFTSDWVNPEFDGPIYVYCAELRNDSRVIFLAGKTQCRFEVNEFDLLKKCWLKRRLEIRSDLAEKFYFLKKTKLLLCGSRVFIVGFFRGFEVRDGAGGNIFYPAWPVNGEPEHIYVENLNTAYYAMKVMILECVEESAEIVYLISHVILTERTLLLERKDMNVVFFSDEENIHCGHPFPCPRNFQFFSFNLKERKWTALHSPCRDNLPELNEGARWALVDGCFRPGCATLVNPRRVIF